MGTDQRRHGTTGAGKSARSVHTTMMPADIKPDDEEYRRDVEKIEAVQASRGAYILGQGALDKNDAAFLLEEEEKRMRAVKRTAESERRLFAEMVAASRRAALPDREVEGGVDAEMGMRGRGKRVKGMVAGIHGATTTVPVDTSRHDQREDEDEDEEEKEDEHEEEKEESKEKEKKDEQGSGLLQGLLGAYDSDDDEEETARVALPSALDVLL